MRIGIVLGYGVALDEPYKTYLDFVARTCGNRDVLVLCGGYTNPQYNRSEARVMAEYLHSAGLRQILLLEEKSIDTPSNLKNAYKIIARDMPPSKDRVVVWCDRIRRFKVYWMARWLFGHVEIRSIERERSLHKAIRQYLRTPLEILAFHLPCLHRIKIGLRRRRWGLSDPVE